MALNSGRGCLKYSLVFSRLNKGVQSSRRWVAQALTYENTLTAPETKLSALKNQLRVVTNNNGAATATVGVWVNAGSRNETEANNGVAHLLEHLAFKGTSKRSAADLELEAEAHGIHLSAQSSRELTALYAKCRTSELPKAVELLADVVLRSSNSEADVEAQRTAVLDELEATEYSNHSGVTMDYLYTAAYQATPLSKSILGTTSSIKSLTRKDVTEFINKHYKTPRMVLAAAGGVDHSDLLQLAEKHFADASPVVDQAVSGTTPCRFTGSEIRARYDDLPLAHIAIAIEGAPYGSPDTLALMVAQAVIGSWDRTYAAGANLSGRLQSACAQEELCHSFQSFYHKYSDTGLWGTQFVADRLTVEDMMFNVQGEWMRLCSSVTEFEVQRAKNQLKTALMTKLSHTTPSCVNLARQALYLGPVRTLAELDTELEAINARTVRDVCMKYIYDKCPAVAGLGPVEGLPDYNRVRGSMYWLRL